MQSPETWYQRGKAYFEQFREVIMAPPANVQPSVWYSGLGIEPTEFSEQLARLQFSLRPESKQTKETPSLPTAR